MTFVCLQCSTVLTRLPKGALPEAPICNQCLREARLYREHRDELQRLGISWPRGKERGRLQKT